MMQRQRVAFPCSLHPMLPQVPGLGGADLTSSFDRRKTAWPVGAQSINQSPSEERGRDRGVWEQEVGEKLQVFPLAARGHSAKGRSRGTSLLRVCWRRGWSPSDSWRSSRKQVFEGELRTSPSHLPQAQHSTPQECQVHPPRCWSQMLLHLWLFLFPPSSCIWSTKKSHWLNSEI